MWFTVRSPIKNNDKRFCDTINVQPQRQSLPQIAIVPVYFRNTSESPPEDWLEEGNHFCEVKDQHIISILNQKHSQSLAKPL